MKSDKLTDTCVVLKHILLCVWGVLVHTGVEILSRRTPEMVWRLQAKAVTMGLTGHLSRVIL